MKVPKKIYAVDLFCGAGGTSTGLAQACKGLGVEVDLVAINHWTTAVNSHAKNHPWARHLCVPVESVNPREAVPGGLVHIMCLSPECTHHSTARGGKPTSDQLRASAWHVMRWVHELDVRTILLENVPEFANWGPVGKTTGRPIKRGKGQYFRAFVKALEDSGYKVEWRILNAADYGAATSRRRLFLAARKGKTAPVWPTATHSKAGAAPGTKRWRAAREIIDWNLQGQSIFGRKKPLSDKTVERILKGLERHGGPDLQPFLVLLRGTGTSQTVDRPVPSLTAGGNNVGVAEPFILSMASEGAPRPVSEPAPTFVAGGGGSLVEPVLMDTFGSKDTWPARAQPVTEPLRTVAGNGRWGVAEPVLVPYNGNSTPSPVTQPMPTQPTHDRFGLVEPFIITTDRLLTNRSLPRPVSEPVPTVMAHNDRIGLAEAFLVPQFGEREGQQPRTHSVDDPLPTPTSHGAGALVEPHILHVTHGGRERSIDDPLPTITGANRGELAIVEPVLLPPDGPMGNGTHNVARSVEDPLPTIRASRGDCIGLIQPVVNGRKLDIRFRMLQPHELAKAMGFPAEYVFEGSRRAIVKQVGNAVEVNQSRHLVLSLLTGQETQEAVA